MKGQKMTEFRKLLAGAKLPERTVPICLRGDLAAEFEELEEQLQEALRKPADSLEGDGSGDIVDRMDALRAEMQEHTYRFRLRAMPKPKWRAFIAEHPPRKDEESGEVDERDKYVGVNTETFYDALVRRCLVDPELDDDEWERLAGEDGVLTDRQLGDLADAAWSVNRREVDIPFSLAASRMTRNTASE